MRASNPHTPRREAGFTLLEVIVAAAMSAVIILALQGAFFGAMKLRERAYAAVESGQRETWARTLLERDLKNAVPPTDSLSDSWIGQQNGSDQSRNDSFAFYTSTGEMQELLPWGVVQNVMYQLTPSTDPTRPAGMDLVRYVIRNLNAPETGVQDPPESEIVMQNVNSLAFSYYDGSSWLDSWDSTEEEAKVPEAVLVQIAYLSEEDLEAQNTRNPNIREDNLMRMEILVPVTVKPQEESSSDETASQSDDGGSGGDTNGGDSGGQTPGGSGGQTPGGAGGDTGGGSRPPGGSGAGGGGR
ncbi:MAG: hypothetical protein GC154_14940 [bacterium]|nr:hypothetical protein [bacterium]